MKSGRQSPCSSSPPRPALPGRRQAGGQEGSRRGRRARQGRAARKGRAQRRVGNTTAQHTQLGAVAHARQVWKMGWGRGGDETEAGRRETHEARDLRADQPARQPAAAAGATARWAGRASRSGKGLPRAYAAHPAHTGRCNTPRCGHRQGAWARSCICWGENKNRVRGTAPLE